MAPKLKALIRQLQWLHLLIHEFCCSLQGHGNAPPNIPQLLNNWFNPEHKSNAPGKQSETASTINAFLFKTTKTPTIPANLKLTFKKTFEILAS